MPARRRSNVTIAQIAYTLDAIAPLELAQPWDNVGLLAGDPQAKAKRVLLCIDLTAAVLAEAIEEGCSMIVAYHPPIFKPIARLRSDSSGTDGLVHQAIAAGLAIYSPHTALDAAPGGTNDVMADLCGLTAIEPFEYPIPPATQSKIVTFVPHAQVDHVADALAAAGAGRIGDYQHCSYRSHGRGTFFGTQSTQPRIGRRDRLEMVEETRLEMVLPQCVLPEVVDALLRSHPYEEPAYDIYPLTPAPTFGIGRVGLLPAKTTLGRLAERLAKAVRSQVACLVGSPRAPIARAAVCVGSAGRLPWDKPRSAGCDVLVTGELHHHDALALTRMGKTAIVLGHWESERPALKPLAARLRGQLAALAVSISRQDAPPFQKLK